MMVDTHVCDQKAFYVLMQGQRDRAKEALGIGPELVTRLNGNLDMAHRESLAVVCAVLLLSSHLER